MTIYICTHAPGGSFYYKKEISNPKNYKEHIAQGKRLTKKYDDWCSNLFELKRRNKNHP